MVDQRGDLGMGIVLDRGQEGLGGRIRGDRIAAEPPAAERVVALDDGQAGAREIGEAALLRCGGEQRGAGRAAADDQHRVHRLGAARAARCGADRRIDRAGDVSSIVGGHRIGDRQREHPRGDIVGDRRRLDERMVADPRLLARDAG